MYFLSLRVKGLNTIETSYIISAHAHEHTRMHTYAFSHTCTNIFSRTQPRKNSERIFSTFERIRTAPTTTVVSPWQKLHLSLLSLVPN